MKLALIIPAYNEDQSIGPVVKQAAEFGTVIVVNDNSTDRTQQVAETNGALVISHSTNKGYEEAINSGFEKARALECTHVITLDADGQHPVEYVPYFIKAFEAGNDLIMGIRSGSSYQRYGEAIFARYTKYRFKRNKSYGPTDPLCGFKGYSMKFYNQVGYFDRSGLVGTELAIRGLVQKVKYHEIGITARYRQHGQSRFAQSLKGELKIFRALFRILLIQW